MSKLDQIIVALDNMTENEALSFVEENHHTLKFYKVGMELFYKSGRDFLKKLSENYQVRIFLDLKLYDIPNTVSKAISTFEGLNIEFLTIHTSGGREMLEKAQIAASKAIPNCKLLGVTVLTSFSPASFKETLGTDFEDGISNLYKTSLSANIPGIVCSTQDIQKLKAQNHGNHPLFVCPGIRFEDEIQSGQISDQKRVASPKEAFKIGADYLVIGRSLTSVESNLRTKRIEEISLIK
ncbi:MAG: orotidine-5'-phosphate decarboxylase [Bacteriovoracaceae bacterium]